MVKHRETIFPFELYITSNQGRRFFTEDVAKILKTDLQLEDSFGCEIKDCHTHVGSKKHLKNFIEGELLFHNSYYNKRFAFLTIQTIYRHLQSDTKRIVLIGYETFSELYLCETLEMLEKLRNDGELQNVQNVGYCVYEQIGDKTRIRDFDSCLRRENTELFEDFMDGIKNTLFVLSVPVNTTLTTHDKMIESLDRQLIRISQKTLTIKDCKMINIALIMIAPSEIDGSNKNDFWFSLLPNPKEEFHIRLCETKQKVLKALSDRNVFCYVKVDSEWVEPWRCTECFPDISEKQLVEETPNFSVDKASIVPMLKMSKKKYAEPPDEDRRKKEEQNIQKVIELANVSYHNHILRSGNHFQYYFDMEKYFNQNRDKIEWWLIHSVKKELNSNDKCYDFIISPRHYSNAGFVRMVNDVVFDSRARIFYFDVSKEYRSNITAKYSDFTIALENIRDANVNYQVNFHYVDDQIFSGNNYNRAKSLLSTVIGNKKNMEINFYKSIILLLNRNSDGSKMNYIDDISRYFAYVNLEISPMRNNEDACTLCRLRDEYKKLEKFAATNELVGECKKTIKRHHLKPVEKIKPSTREEKIRLVIRHMLTVRIKNDWWIDNKNEAINQESKESIYNTLKNFFNYDQIYNYIKNLKTESDALIELDDICLNEEFYNAFIKIITRPFFTNHIRQRQAAMKFCLEQINVILEKKKDPKNIKDSLIKGLADLGANYLIRKDTIEKILSSEGHETPSYFKAVKKITSSSGEDTQSYLLECILVTGNEGEFFKNEKLKEDKLKGISFHDWAMLYMENNKVMRDGLEEYYRNEDVRQMETGLPYYMEMFNDTCRVNLQAVKKETESELNKKVRELCKNYQIVKDLITEGFKTEVDFEKIETEFSKILNVGRVRFFGCREEENILFRYLLLNQKESGSRDDGSFYQAQNLHEIDQLIRDDKKNSIGQTIYFGKSSCIIRIKIRGKVREYEDAVDNSGDLFIQILYENFIRKPCYELKEDELPAHLLLFKIKILLILRSDLVKLGKKQNIANLVERAYKNEIKSALQIEKAHRHGTAEYYEDIMQWGRDEGERFSANNYLNGMNAKVHHKDLFDMYMQVLANNLIVSLYRGMVLRKAGDSSYTYSSRQGSVIEWRDEILPEYGFLDTTKDNSKNRLEYTIKVPTGRRGIVNVKMVCIFHPECVRKEKFIYSYCLDGCWHSAFYLIMTLLAINAGIHGKEDDKEQVEVFYHFIENDIVIENAIEDSEKVEVEWKNKMEMPPWRNENKSITLWTFNQLSSDPKKNEVFFEAEVKNNKFKVTLKKSIRDEKVGYEN